MSTAQTTGLPWAAPKPDAVASSSPRRTGTTLARELIMPALLLGFAVFLTVQMLSMNVPDTVDFPGPRFFPAIIAGMIFVLSTVQLVSSVRAWSSGRLEAELTRERRETGAHFSWGSLAWVVLGFLGFALLLEVLGWVIAGGLLFWCVTFAFGHRKPLKSLVVGLTVSSFAYIAFDMALGLNLPSGLLGGSF